MVKGRKPTLNNVVPLTNCDDADVERRHHQAAKRLANKLKPKTLSKEAAIIWRREAPHLAHPNVNRLKELNADMFGLYCEAFARWMTLKILISEIGETYETGHGRNGNQTRLRPEVNQMNAAFNTAVNLGKEFGKTPASERGLSSEGQRDLFDPETDSDFS